MNIGAPQVIHANADPEVMQQVSQMLGQMGISVQGGQPTGFASDRVLDGDDTISQLERLSALRASGAFSEEELQEQKRRVLGGA
ncbi:MAG TPA: SHOCT domain-containing protein [Solirubrobacterales bacterium]|nr:SHOCT domain-containing protein [Solirubrobacterales bacterium]